MPKNKPTIAEKDIEPTIALKGIAKGHSWEYEIRNNVVKQSNFIEV